MTRMSKTVNVIEDCTSKLHVWTFVLFTLMMFQYHLITKNNTKIIFNEFSNVSVVMVLQLMYKKRIFGSQTVRFLGYDISADGVTPAAERVTTILEYEKPLLVKNLRRFLGMINFFFLHTIHSKRSKKPSSY